MLVRDEQVEFAVVIDVHPCGRLRRSRRFREPALLRDVAESAVTIIPQQRKTFRQLPATPQNQDIDAAIVVVVSLRDIQPAELIRQSRLDTLVDETAVAVVVEVT